MGQSETTKSTINVGPETPYREWHVSRSWGPSTPIEDECPCPQEPCGHVLCANVDPSCEQHHGSKTIRSAHAADECPGRRARS